MSKLGRQLRLGGGWLRLTDALPLSSDDISYPYIFWLRLFVYLLRTFHSKLQNPPDVSARMASTMDVTSLRKHFPALDKKQIYFDNAGGSQCLQEVIDA